MKDKIALITGGMGGIGTAICKYLSDHGAQVIAGYYHNGDHKSAQTWQKEQKEQGYNIAINYADVRDFESCASMAQQIKKTFGNVDILVNNAGITCDTQLYKMKPEEWAKVLRTNLDSVFNVTRNVVNGMIEQRYGRIINIASINAQKGQFGQTNYATAKAGMYGFTKSLALEVARKGITVNTISPGYIDTQMVAAIPSHIREQIIAQIPIGRFGQPEEIARAVHYLASDESGFITGSNLVINGGQYLF